MTTRVIVQAHCGENTEVHVEVANGSGRIDAECSVIEDGESVEKVVYDDRTITVREVQK